MRILVFFIACFFWSGNLWAAVPPDWTYLILKESTTHLSVAVHAIHPSQNRAELMLRGDLPTNHNAHDIVLIGGGPKLAAGQRALFVIAYDVTRAPQATNSILYRFDSSGFRHQQMQLQNEAGLAELNDAEVLLWDKTNGRMFQMDYRGRAIRTAPAGWLRMAPQERIAGLKVVGEKEIVVLLRKNNPTPGSPGRAMPNFRLVGAELPPRGMIRDPDILFDVALPQEISVAYGAQNQSVHKVTLEDESHFIANARGAWIEFCENSQQNPGPGQFSSHTLAIFVDFLQLRRGNLIPGTMNPVTRVVDYGTIRFLKPIDLDGDLNVSATDIVNGDYVLLEPQLSLQHSPPVPGPGILPAGIVTEKALSKELFAHSPTQGSLLPHWFQWVQPAHSSMYGLQEVDPPRSGFDWMQRSRGVALPTLRSLFSAGKKTAGLAGSLNPHGETSLDQDASPEPMASAVSPEMKKALSKVLAMLQNERDKDREYLRAQGLKIDTPETVGTFAAWVRSSRNFHYAFEKKHVDAEQLEKFGFRRDRDDLHAVKGRENDALDQEALLRALAEKDAARMVEDEQDRAACAEALTKHKP